MWLNETAGPRNVQKDPTQTFQKISTTTPAIFLYLMVKQEVRSIPRMLTVYTLIYVPIEQSLPSVHLNWH